MSEVRVRMAPSPTGKLHLGTAYTTFFNYLFAKKMAGKFILRIEDTDKERNKTEFEESILNGLEWLGLKWDEGPFRQTERLESYKKATEKLISEGKAYYCFCTPLELDEERKKLTAEKKPQIYSGKCRNLSKEEVEKNLSEGKKHAVRFGMPENRGKISWNDLLHGELGFEAALLGDMVIMRQNGIPLYNFAVVVDDIDMKISHVLRGDDHLSNTPKQIVIFEALNGSIPEFAHWPMILNPDRIGKLSKRQNATSIEDYKQDGFLKEAMLNYFAILGWTMPDDREIVSFEEMEKSFDLKKMRLSGAAFNIEKLEWLNGEYIRAMSDEELTTRLEDYLVDHPAKDKIGPVVPLIKERIKKLSDFIPLTDFLFEEPEYDLSVFNKIKIEDKVIVLDKIHQTLIDLGENWEKERFENSLQELAKSLEIPNREFFQLLRAAVSGQLVSPPLFESMKILGEGKSGERIIKAKSFIENPPKSADF